MTTMDRSVRIAGLFILLLASSSLCWACNVPVFRYALDHWRPDSYRAILYSQGPLSEALQTDLKRLQAGIDSQNVNLSIKHLDVTQLNSTELPSSVAQLNLAANPYLLVYYPADLRIAEPIATMPFESSQLESLIDSPLRHELTKRLAAGQSAVYLFVASGDEAADGKARMTLESELRSLQSTLELPKLTDDPDDKIVGGPALRIEFSILDVNKSDDAEWAVRSLLLGSEPDLKELNEPLVFPVFGCGRALWPLVGAGINADNLRESATFVSGACSCQVKEQNPGFDLLINANWEEMLPWTTAEPSGHNLGSTVEVPQTIPIPSGSQMSNELLAMGLGSAATGQTESQAPAQAATSGSMSMIIIAVVAVAAIAVIAFLVSRKRALAS